VIQIEVPEQGEIVVVKISKVLNYGVFVELLEYEGVTGFVHISEIVSTWIKNIRNFVKENQIRAAKVLKVDTYKNQIDLSLVKVSAGLQRTKIEEWKQLKRTQKLIEVMAKEQKKDFETAWREVAEPLIEEYDSLYKGLQEIAIKGEKAASMIPKAWLAPLLEIVEKNIEIPVKTLRGTITLKSNAVNGVELIKKSLSEAQKEAKKAEITYKGSGSFYVKVQAPDYKTAEKNLRKVLEKAVHSIESMKGKGSYEIQGKKVEAAA